jgi:hypothetical protein
MDATAAVPADPNLPGGYTWVEDESAKPIRCPGKLQRPGGDLAASPEPAGQCPGMMHMFRVWPDRSSAWTRSILLCDTCKRTF